MKPQFAVCFADYLIVFGFTNSLFCVDSVFALRMLMFVSGVSVCMCFSEEVQAFLA